MMHYDWLVWKAVDTQMVGRGGSWYVIERHRLTGRYRRRLIEGNGGY